MNRELEALRDRVRYLNIVYGWEVRSGSKQSSDETWAELEAARMQLREVEKSNELNRPD